MILQALRDLAKREELVSDPDFPIGKVSWMVTVSGSVPRLVEIQVAASV